MSNATVSNLGQVNGAGSTSALFLKLFAGEVITQFEEKNIMMGLHQTRTITNGKSASFPVMGTAAAAYHVVGAEILGGEVKHAEKIITVDELLVAPAFISNIEEAKNHYDVRATYTSELGNALANTFDKNALRMVVNAARGAETITSSGKAGLQISKANYTTTANIISALFEAAEAMDAKDIPTDGRTAVVSPAIYYKLAQDTTIMNKDWGGAGVYADAKVIRVAGIAIVMSNHLPTGNQSAVTGENNTYHGDFTKTKAVVFHQSAIGTVKLMDLALESEYDIRRQGTLFVAKYAMGSGILRPESAIELKLT
jgi:hypothetical protein|tara:strand:+ start:3009 stop:3944 length:936 start_codon:yes stop_codon:yes gene_type:complete